MVTFGICDVDGKDCYSKGAICRLNRKAGFQIDYNYDNPQKPFPFRNKGCSHFHKKEEEVS